MTTENAEKKPAAEKPKVDKAILNQQIADKEKALATKQTIQK